MLTIIFTFMALVVSNYYTTQHGPLEWFGMSFTLGAILFTPAYVARDVLHEQGKAWYIFFSIFAGVAAVYIYAETRFTTTLGLTLICSYLIDTNIYILARGRGIWFARITSDLFTLSLGTLMFYHLQRDPPFDITDQIFVRYLTAFVCYGILYAYERYCVKPIKIEAEA